MRRIVEALEHSIDFWLVVIVSEIIFKVFQLLVYRFEVVIVAIDISFSNCDSLNQTRESVFGNKNVPELVDINITSLR